MYFPVLHALLHLNDMRVTKTCFSQCSMAALLFLPALPVVWLATWIESRHQIKRSRKGGRDLLRWLINVNNLFSDKLIICAQKSDPRSA